MSADISGRGTSEPATPEAPRLETARLTLRPLAREDAPALHLILNDPAVMAGLHNTAQRAIEEVEAWIAVLNQEARAGRGYAVGITARVSGALLGFARLQRDTSIDARSEITIALASQHQCEGRGAEAAEELIAWGFRELPLDRVIGHVLPGNTASARLMSNLGFVKMGQRTIPGRDGNPVEWEEFDLTRQGWMRRIQEQGLG